MKRGDILRKLAEAGFTFEEGTNHTKAIGPDGKVRTVIGRHNEIHNNVVRSIEKQTGVKIL